MDTEESIRPGNLVEQKYTVHGKLFATRTSEGFRAVSNQSGEEVILWFLRHKLEDRVDAAEKFERRLQRISELDLATPKMREYGVDSSGAAYLVTDINKAPAFLSVNRDPKSLGSAFKGAVTAISRLHAQGIGLGDICDQSFLVGAQGRVYLVAVMGIFDVETKHTTLLPPQQTLHYLAPEQRAGVGAELACDIYAIGVLGYRLFTGRFLSGNKPPSSPHEDPTLGAPAPSLENPDLPSWVDDILGKCLMMSPNERFNHAGELLSAIGMALDSGTAPITGGIWSRKTLIVRPDRAGTLVRESVRDSELVKHTKVVEEEIDEEKSVASQRKVFMLSIGLLVGVFVGGLAYLFFEPSAFNSDAPLSDGTDTLGQLLPAHVKPWHHDLFSTRVSAERKLSALDKIAKEEDSVIPLYVANIASTVDNPRIRKRAEEILTDRAYQQELTLSASQIETYFNNVRLTRETPPSKLTYINIAKASDLSLPPDTRVKALEQLHNEVPEFGKFLSASLALDTEGRPEFIRALRMIRVMEGRSVPSGAVGLWPLILLDPQLAARYGNRLKKSIDNLTEKELAWTLLHFAESDDPLLFDIAQATVDRRIVPQFQEVFLKILLTANRSTMERAQKVALAHSARGESSVNDIRAFGRWYDINAESALLSICAIAQDDNIALAAFDTLGARSLSTQPARTLVEWIRGNFFEHRLKAVKSIGILGHTDIATQEQVDYAFNHLVPFSQGGSFIKLMVKAGEPELIRRSVEVLGKLLQDEELLRLLTHQNAGVRLEAVRALEGRNDLRVLQQINRACVREKDPEIRAEYRRLHWVARDCK